MILYENDSTDAYFNMAAEQYLLDTAGSPCAMLWRNGKAVVIGKNQNAAEQLDLRFCRENGITPVRRLTGGGAVFHDLGNVNFTFIVPDDSKKLDFAAFSRPVIGSLERLGLKCRLSGRNDIVADTADGERKISGEAQCVYEAGGTKKVLHHGTLLFSADLSLLAGALRADPAKMLSKGIRSVSSRVANVKDLIATDLDADGFLDYLKTDLAARTGAERRFFTDGEKAAIQKLADTKYASDEWLFGRFGRGGKSRRFPFGTVGAEISEKDGAIESLRFTGDFFGAKDADVLAASLAGTRLSEQELMRALAHVGEYIHGATAADITRLLLDK